MPYNFRNLLQPYLTIKKVLGDDCILESEDVANEMRELFETDREENAGRLVEFVRSRRWTFEWSRGRLVVYKFDDCVAADEISRFAAEVVALNGLIMLSVFQIKRRQFRIAAIETAPAVRRSFRLRLFDASKIHLPAVVVLLLTLTARGNAVYALESQAWRCTCSHWFVLRSFG